MTPDRMGRWLVVILVLIGCGGAAAPVWLEGHGSHAMAPPSPGPELVPQPFRAQVEGGRVPLVEVRNGLSLPVQLTEIIIPAILYARGQGFTINTEYLNQVLRPLAEPIQVLAGAVEVFHWRNPNDSSTVGRSATIGPSGTTVSGRVLVPRGATVTTRVIPGTHDTGGRPVVRVQIGTPGTHEAGTAGTRPRRRRIHPRGDEGGLDAVSAMGDEEADACFPCACTGDTCAATGLSSSAGEATCNADCVFMNPLETPDYTGLPTDDD